jgi:hydrogenase maturation protein HypF
MMPDVATVEKHCFVDDIERKLLESRERPIVILRRRPESTIAHEVAPGQDTIGVMLPYTPLHYLLFASIDPAPNDSPIAALVMTSGNLSEEPIATGNDEALERLASLADSFLMHDRPIRTRCDDSVIRTLECSSVPTFQRSNILMLRRSRGYAPNPIRLPWEFSPLLATGSELKNTFCLARERYAFLSHHIGDLENYETLQSFEDGIVHFERLFRIRPKAIAYDLHPNYLATRYALDRAERERLPAIGVQHHHAHIAACMADNELGGDHPVIGVAFDGTGYGEDGAIWGGEFLVADYSSYRRVAHLAYAPLPGGDAAIRHPWRTALAWLHQAGIEWTDNLQPVQFAINSLPPTINHLTALRHQLEHHINAPLTSSMGRLFDAAAALAGVRQQVNYEAQAAIEFEALVDPHEKGAYQFDIVPQAEPDSTFVLRPSSLFETLLVDLRAGISLPMISARFHNGVAEMVRQMVTIIHQETGITHVALSGGVWQNCILLTKTVQLLQDQHFIVLTHRLIPPNDGGVALGQAMVGSRRITT